MRFTEQYLNKKGRPQCIQTAENDANRNKGKMMQENRPLLHPRIKYLSFQIEYTMINSSLLSTYCLVSLK